jgi:hypothetical protein
MTTRQDALIEVVDTIKRHGLTLEEIYAALQDAPGFAAEKSGNILMRAFGYIGGLFVFLGVCAFVAMQWDGMGDAGHIMVTLGFGFCLFVMALTCSTNDKLAHVAAPLFITSAVLEPGGILVTMEAFSRGGNPSHGVLLMLFLMAFQQGCAFIARDLTVLAFTTLVFGGLFMFVAMDVVGFPVKLEAFVMGVSLMCIGWALDKSKHKGLAWIGYLVGSCLLMGITGHTLYGTNAEIIFVGISIGIVYLATVTRSKTLLVTGTLGTLGYVSYLMGKIFGDTIFGPLGLIVIGALMIGGGVLAVKINTKYIKQKG